MGTDCKLWEQIIICNLLGLALFIVLCFSYVDDITTKKTRMFRIVIIDNDMISLLGAGVQLVPIKTLQSLNAKFRVINESFETNLDCYAMTRD